MANFCSNCGAKLVDGRCPNCGHLPSDAPQAMHPQEIFSIATEKINELAGEKGAVNLNIRSLFSQVFYKHTAAESEEIFISGTSKTTPPLEEINTTWPKPWLFSRVFLMFVVTFFALFICFDMFQNPNALPGVIFIGAMAVPLSLLIFFMEVNAPRNISFFDTMKVFFVGGGASLVMTLFLFSVVGSIDGYIGAIIIGIVEEGGKLIIIVYYIKKLPKVNYVLNGMLIGAAVGAGFATFETAGYILNFGLNYGTEVMYDVLVLRAFFAPGGHVVWSAIIGAAFMLVKRDAPFDYSQLKEKKFLIFTGLCIAMHAVWDMPIQIEYRLVQIAMTICAWVIVLVLINVGLKEISDKICKVTVPQTDALNESENHIN